MTDTQIPQDPADPKPEPDKTAAAPRRKRRAWLWLAVVLCVPVLVVAAALLASIGRDIDAPEWVVAQVEDRASAVLGGGSLAVGKVTVNLGRDLHPRVRMSDTIVRDAAGSPLARIPLIEALFSPRGIVLQRDALMQELRVTGAQVNLRRSEDGSVAVSFQAGGADVEQASSLLDLLDQSDRIFDMPALAALETIRADGVVVNYADTRAGRAWTVDGGQIALNVRDATTKLTGEFAVLSGGAGITTLAVSYESPRDSQIARFDAQIEDARAADIAAQSPALSWLAGVDAPISAQLSSARAADGTLEPFTAQLRLGAGALQPNAATDPIPFDGATADLSFDPVSNTINFREVAVQGDLGQVQASGQAFLSDMRGGLPQSLTGQFRFGDTAINRPDVYPAPLVIPEMLVDMRLNLSPFVLDVGQIYATLPGIDVLGRGRLAATDTGWDAAFDMEVAQAALADILALWPELTMPKVRSWVATAIHAADFRDLNIAVRRNGAGPVTTAGSFGFEALNLTYLSTLPPIEAGKGTGVFTEKDFAIALDAGQVTAPQGGPLDVAGSTMIIPDLTAQYRPATYALVMDGNITAALSLLEQPPMRYMTKAKLPVDVASGTARVEMALRHPMRRDMTAEDINFSATAVLRNLSSDGLIPDRSLSARALELSVDKQALTISGNAVVDSVPLNGTWTQTYGQGATLAATVTLNNARLQAFGVDLPPGSVSGEGQAQLNLRLPPDAAPQYAVSSDLRGLQIAIPAVGWAKAPSVAGNLEVAGRLGDDPQVDQLSISGGGLEVRGDVTFQPNGDVDRVRLTRVEISDWLNAPIILRGRGAGQPFAVEIGGGVIDLRRASFGSGNQESGPISIALDRLQLTQGITLNRFVGSFTSTGGFAGQFTAWINNVGQIQGTVAPRNGRSAIRIVSNDAGGVALATGLMQNALGGTLDLTMVPTAGRDGTFDGRLAIRSLRIKDAPAMAALLDAISVVGLLQQLDGQGLSFDTVDAAFRLTPQQVIVTESSAVGPGLGISLDGLYTLATKQMDFQGVISPFFLINSIGSIFTRRGEGLIGFNFTILGTSDAPEVSVNPLSAFTPGMFRNIFRRDPPVVSQ